MRRPRARGFTLVELMVVVVIVGVLAALGVAALRKFTKQAKIIEGLDMVQSIRSAQERFKTENLRYLNVSPTGAWYPVDPAGDTGQKVARAFHFSAGHPDHARWVLLNPTTPSGVEFGYVVRAGLPSDAIAQPLMAVQGLPNLNRGSTAGRHWYLIEAKANLDRSPGQSTDGVYTYFVAINDRSEIYRDNEGE